MLESVTNLKKKSKKGATAENTAFQQLFLLVGIHLFKVKIKNRKNKPATNKTSCQTVSVIILFPLKAPEELLDIMKDLQSCVDKAQEKKAKKKKKQKGFLEMGNPETWSKLCKRYLY